MFAIATSMLWWLVSRLKWCWFQVPSLSPVRRISIVLHPREENVASKGAEFDEILIVDLPPLVACLVTMMSNSFRLRQKNLQPLKPERFNQAWRKGAELAGLVGNIGVPHLYVLRGRWRTDASVK